MEKDEKTIDDVLNEVVDGKEPAPEADPKPPESEDNKATDPNSEDPAPEPKDDNSDDEGNKDPQPDDKKSQPEKKEDSSVIKNLRQQQRESSKQVKQYEAMIERLANQQGITKDELIENLQKQADEKEAKEKNISPEIQKQLREQREALETLKQERQREVFNSKFDKLNDEFPMNNDQAKEFVQGAINIGVDLGNPNTDFKAVYIALNHEKIIKEIREDERQKTLKRIEEQGKKSPQVTKKRDQGDGVKKGSIDEAIADILGT